MPRILRNGSVVSPEDGASRLTANDTMNNNRSALTETVKKWKILPGRNAFLCDGRVVTGRQPYVFYLTCVLIIVISGLFFAFDCRFLWHRLSPAIPIIAALIFIFVMGTLIRTSWSDPGIIPRASPQEAIDTERLIEASTAAGAGLTPADNSYQPPRLRDITINGVTLKLKYCPTCKIFRPPRASHCSTCDNCVERFDHHCPWVGNCIGRRNYRYFYLFLVSVSLDCVFICAFSVTTIVMNSLEDDFTTAMKNYPTSIVEAVVAFFSLWSVIGLAGFHTFLAACNLTTNEDIKKSYSKADQRNPYSQGSIFKNYCEVVCGPTPPSLIDARCEVVVDGPEYVEILATGVQRPPTAARTNPASHNGYNTRSSSVAQSAVSKPYPTQPVYDT